MLDEYRITPELMCVRADAYAKLAGNIHDIIKKLDGLCDQLAEEWTGEASRAYRDMFKELRPGFVQAADTVEKISASLKTSAQMAEDSERNIASQFKKY